MEEFKKASEKLANKGVKLEIEPHLYGPGAIARITELPGCDFAIYIGTHGADEGLLEVYGLPLLNKEEREIAGFLTADEVVGRVTRALSV